MILNRLFAVLIGSGFLVAQNVKPELVRPAEASEMLAYSYARKLASARDHETPQPGPLFVEGRLVFTSLDAQDNSKILLLNAGAGNFVIPLLSQGVNKISFDLPVAGERKAHRFFLSYMHGGRLRSRYFEFSEEHPPIGKEASDFQKVAATRATNLLPHLNYAIHETAHAVTSAPAGRMPASTH